MIFIASVLLSLLTSRLIGGAEHYDTVGLGNFENGVDADEIAQIDPQIIEPILIIKQSSGGFLNITVDDVICWDIMQWIVEMFTTIDTTGTEAVGMQFAHGGVVKDNNLTPDVTDPVGSNDIDAATANGDLHPGGGQPAVTSADSVGEEVPAFEMVWATDVFASEENATGEINKSFGNFIQPSVTPNYKAYEIDGNTFFHILTAAHYKHWMNSLAISTLIQLSLGMLARPMSLDITEVIFDRGQLLSVIQALDVLA